jgi:hypothetical protein
MNSRQLIAGIRQLARTEQRLVLGLLLPTLDVDGHVGATRLYRRLRNRGVTVRGTID